MFLNLEFFLFTEFLTSGWPLSTLDNVQFYLSVDTDRVRRWICWADRDWERTAGGRTSCAGSDARWACSISRMGARTWNRATPKWSPQFTGLTRYVTEESSLVTEDNAVNVDWTCGRSVRSRSTVVAPVSN